MNDERVVEVKELRFDYDGHPALSGVALSVRRGEIFGLVGADGAGKTTLLRLCVGQLTPASGQLRILGSDPRAPQLRPQLAYMPQGFGLYMDLSVQENLAFFADLHGMPRQQARQRSADLLQRTGLKGFEGRRAGHLSGGMMQKLALACALISAPRVMFLDEPTTGVDPVSRRAFWKLLEGVRGEGVSIVYATANMDEAERCDRVGLLEQGSLSRQGTPIELAEVSDATLLQISGPAVRRQRQTLRALDGVDLVFPVGARLHLWLAAGTDPERFRAALHETAPELSAEKAQPTLQDTVLRSMALRRDEAA